MSIRTLVDSSHEGGGYIPQASGLLAELASGPRRSVTSWLAVHDDHPVGLAALVSAGPEAAARHSIAWLLVSGRTRRRGVGSALVATALQAASARGAREVWAETRADWSAAIAFWSAVGFRPVA